MAKQRRKMKRSPPPWKSAIGFSIGVHAVIILCIVGVGWRYLHQDTPGLPILIHEVMLGDGTVGGWHAEGSPSSEPHSVTSKSKIPIPPAASSETMGSRVTGPAAVQEEVRTGTGTGNGTGNASGNGSGSGGGNPTLAEIRRRIEAAKRYPAQARAMHQEGRVGVRFRIQPNGQIAEVHITQSSGVPALDDAAIQAVTRSAPLPYYSAAIEFPITFHLR